MAKCETCGASPLTNDRVTLLRQNPKGEAGIWRCETCNRLPVDPEMAQVLAAIQSKREPLQ